MDVHDTAEDALHVLQGATVGRREEKNGAEVVGEGEGRMKEKEGGRKSKGGGEEIRDGEGRMEERVGGRDGEEVDRVAKEVYNMGE